MGITKRFMFAKYALEDTFEELADKGEGRLICLGCQRFYLWRQEIPQCEIEELANSNGEIEDVSVLMCCPNCPEKIIAERLKW
jgi:uncharacterized protein YbaR (Trm112 family)